MNQIKIKELEQIISSKYGNTTGIIIIKDGDVSYEKYFKGCTANSRVHIYSVTKSIISILIGIALDKGYIKNIEEKVLDYFPEYKVKRGERRIQNITLRNMLTMTAPYKYRFFAPYIKYFTSNDWVKFSLDLLGGRGKIGAFRYAPLIGPDILSGILVRATGQPVLDFAAENLFEPLGIKVGNRFHGDSCGRLGAYAYTNGYGKDWAVISEWRYVGGEADHFLKMGRGQYNRTQPMEKRESALWISMVGK